MTQLALGPLTLCGATVSPCGRYRYSLTRGPDAHRLCWIMCNPSTADDLQDDATIRRCAGYAQRWGFPGFTVVNLFALRSTDPAALQYCDDPVGPDNDRHLVEAARAADLVVAAWGSWGCHRDRDVRVSARLAAEGVRLHCLRVTREGAPAHPVRLPGDLAPLPWPRPEERF